MGVEQFVVVVQGIRRSHLVRAILRCSSTGLWLCPAALLAAILQCTSTGFHFHPAALLVAILAMAASAFDDFIEEPVVEFVDKEGFIQYRMSRDDLTNGFLKRRVTWLPLERCSCPLGGFLGSRQNVNEETGSLLSIPVSTQNGC